MSHCSGLPVPLAQVFAFDSGFLQQRTWPVLLLWLGVFAVRATACSRGRWTSLTRRLNTGFALAWVALMVCGIAAGDIFQAKPTNDGAKAALGLVVLIIVVDLATKWYRRRTPIRLPKIAG